MHLPHSVSYKFGIVAMLSGLIGVPLGSFLAQYFRRTHQRTDPIICAWGLLISAPLVYLALLLARFTEGWCYFIICLAEISLNLCWSIVADILLVSNAFGTDNHSIICKKMIQHTNKNNGKLICSILILKIRVLFVQMWHSHHSTMPNFIKWKHLLAFSW